MYFLAGYGVAYGTHFFVGAEQLAAKNGYELVKFFFLLTFAAAIPAIISGGIAEFHDFAGSVVVHAVGGWIALAGGFVVYGPLKATLGLRLSQEAEFDGADLSIHKISATPEREASW